MIFETLLIVKRVFRHPIIHALIVAFLWEWQKNKFGTIQEFLNNPFGTTIPILFLFGLSYAAVLILHKVFSNNDFISEANLRAKLQEVIEEAEDYLLFVSPYLNPGNVLIESMIKAKKNGVNVVLIHNSNQTKKPKLAKDFGRLLDAEIEIFNHPHLHSKLYVNEHGALVCSLNLVTGSYSESLECGIYTDARSIRNDCKQYIEHEILDSDQCKRTVYDDLSPHVGYCITSKKTMQYDPTHPVEYNEYKKISGPIIGRYCHLCGMEVETSIQQPLCISCQELQEVDNSD